MLSKLSFANCHSSFTNFHLQFVFCKICRQGFHIGECLPEVQVVGNATCEHSVDHVKVADARWDEASKVAIKVSTKPCPKCRTPTERAGGCMHMVSTFSVHLKCLKIKYRFIKVCTRAGCSFE